MSEAPAILAIDTSDAQCAVSVLVGGTAHSRAEPMTRGHAEALDPMVDAALAEAGLTTADLAAVAVCTGPGSFTGLRVGIAWARGLALGRSIPAIGVTRLEALARMAGRAGTVLIEGRGGSGFAQAFDAAGTPAGTPQAGPLDTLRTPDAITGDGLVDPGIVARIAAERLGTPQPRPVPLYLRPADAAPSSMAVPAILDA